MILTIVAMCAGAVIGFVVCAMLARQATHDARVSGFWAGLMTGARSRGALPKLAEKLDELKRSGKAGQG